MASEWNGRDGRGRQIMGRVVACCVLLALAQSAQAGVKSLIAAFATGDEMRYTYTARNEETTGVTGKPGIGGHAVTTETVGLVARCKADTTALRIVEVTYESFRIAVDSPAGRVEVDLGGPAPGEDAPALARELHKTLSGIVGLKLTLNTAPGSGEITLFQGGEEMRKSAGGNALRRYLERDFFAATFGQIFQLKSNSAAPPPGQEWWVSRHIFAYAHPGKSSVWETRVIETVVADIATVKGSTRAKGNPEGSEKVSAFFKGITGDVVYKWDTIRSRLLSASRTEIISSRFDMGGLLRESDVITKCTLEMVTPGAKTAEKAVEKPASQPAEPSTKPDAAKPTEGGKGLP